MVLVSLSGLSIFPFAVAGSPAGIICSLYLVMFVLSAAQGATFSLVTVLDKKFQGSAFGLIGAIGNFVAVLFALMFVYRPFSQSLMVCVTLDYFYDVVIFLVLLLLTINKGNGWFYDNIFGP